MGQLPGVSRLIQEAIAKGFTRNLGKKEREDQKEDKREDSSLREDEKNDSGKQEDNAPDSGKKKYAGEPAHDF